MPPNPAAVLAHLVDNIGKLKVSTLQRRLSAIRERYRRVSYILDTLRSPFAEV